MNLHSKKTSNSMTLEKGICMLAELLRQDVNCRDAIKCSSLAKKVYLEKVFAKNCSYSCDLFALRIINFVLQRVQTICCRGFIEQVLLYCIKAGT